MFDTLKSPTNGHILARDALFYGTGLLARMINPAQSEYELYWRIWRDNGFLELFKYVRFGRYTAYAPERAVAEFYPAGKREYAVYV